MPIDKTKCCNMHTKEKEDNGECCQTKDEQENAHALTYEYAIKTGPEPKSVSQLLQEGMELQRRLEDE